MQVGGIHRGISLSRMPPGAQPTALYGDVLNSGVDLHTALRTYIAGAADSVIREVLYSEHPLYVEKLHSVSNLHKPNTSHAVVPVTVKQKDGSDGMHSMRLLRCVWEVLYR